LPLLADVPQSRLFDEMLKLLQTGHALASIAHLRKLGLERGIYPLLDLVVERADHAFVTTALQDTDRRVGESKPVAPSFLLACVLWADVREGWDQRLARREHSFPALQDAIDEVFNARIGDVSGRGKLAADMREIWMMQPRFEKRVGSTPFGLVEQARFRAAFDFLRLRADVAEVDITLADWWQEFSMADDATREDLVQQAKAERPKPVARRAPRPEGEAAPKARSSARGAAEPGLGSAQEQGPDNWQDGGPLGATSDAPSDAAKKRRRRRRKPGGAEGGASAASGGQD
jgi:poly(A) polymerase